MERKSTYKKNWPSGIINAEDLSASAYSHNTDTPDVETPSKKIEFTTQKFSQKGVLLQVSPIYDQTKSES